MIHKKEITKAAYDSLNLCASEMTDAQAELFGIDDSTEAASLGHHKVAIVDLNDKYYLLIDVGDTRPCNDPSCDVAYDKYDNVTAGKGYLFPDNSWEYECEICTEAFSE